MKITFILPELSLSGGVKIIARHVQLLQRRGHEVLLVAQPSRMPSLRQKIRGLRRGESWPRYDSDRPSHLDGLDLDCRVLDARRPVVDADLPDADVVVATWWETAEWIAALHSVKGAKAYFIQDHEVFDYLPVERAKATYNLPLRKIVVSEWLSDVIAREYGDPSCDVVPNAVDAETFKPGDRLKQPRPTFGFLFSKAPRKSVHLCIEAVEKLKSMVPHLRVLAFGSQRPSPDLPLPSWIEFYRRPPQREIPRLYASCDAWLFSSRSEGFGLPVVEAMACGTPVIGTSAGASPQYIDATTGALVKPDSDAFVEQMLRFFAMDDSEWRQMSACARTRATTYTWDDAADRFEAALFRAIEDSNRSMTVAPTQVRSA